jgi:hypothetical protein
MAKSLKILSIFLLTLHKQRKTSSLTMKYSNKLFFGISEKPSGYEPTILY